MPQQQNTGSTTNVASANDIGIQGSLRDLLLPIVEFLGILVPGVIFNFAFIMTIVLPLIAFTEVISGQAILGSTVFTDALKALFAPDAGTIALIAVFSYVIGHLFFRQDPKIPDQKSFEIVKKTIGEDGPVRLSDNERKYNRDNNIDENKYNLEFPYRYLKEFLSDRGMMHLAEIIPWSGENPATYQYRTKHFINTLKVRIEFLLPYQYLRIQRNEAHVRLMSSMWFASNAICFVSVIGVCIGVVVSLISAISNESIWPLPYVATVICSGVIYKLSGYLHKHIESFLHYQRIREIIFILETAYLANKTHKDFSLADLIVQKDIKA